MLAAIKSVDAVVIFAEDAPISPIETLEPDALVNGADYTLDTVVGADLAIRRVGNVMLAELLNGRSTSDTIKLVVGSTGSRAGEAQPVKSSSWIATGRWYLIADTW